MKNPKTALATQEDQIVISLVKLGKLNLKLDTDIAQMKRTLKVCKKLNGLTATEEAKIALLRSQIKNLSKVNQGSKLILDGVKNLGVKSILSGLRTKIQGN